MIGLSHPGFLFQQKENSSRLPAIRNNQTEHATVNTSKISRFQSPLQSILPNMNNDLDTSECQERLNQSVESINQLMEKPQTKAIRQFFKLDKLKSLNADNHNYTLEQAEECFRSPAKKAEEKAMAAKVIAEESLRSVYGGELPIIEGEGYNRPVRRYKNKLNTKILSQVLNEIQHNSRSHSILIRKSELEQIQAEFKRGQEKKSKFQIVDHRSSCRNEDQRLELMYQLKNQYQILKDFIIVTKSEQYQNFVAQFSTIERLRQLKKTVKMSNLKATNLKSTRIKQDKQNKQMQYLESCKQLAFPDKIKTMKNTQILAKKPRGKFQLTNDRLVLENINQMTPSAFLYMMTQCRFEQIKTVRIKKLNLESELLFFMLDCMKNLGNSENKMDVFELTNLKIQSHSNFGDKLATLMASQPIRCIKLQSLDLNNRQLAKITQALQQSHIINELSFRSNKIDILGVRHIEALCRKAPSIESVDMRMNQIPHYANLKDKSSVIQFF